MSTKKTGQVFTDPSLAAAVETANDEAANANTAAARANDAADNLADAEANYQQVAGQIKLEVRADVDPKLADAEALAQQDDGDVVLSDGTNTGRPSAYRSAVNADLDRGAALAFKTAAEEAATESSSAALASLAHADAAGQSLGQAQAAAAALSLQTAKYNVAAEQERDDLLGKNGGPAASTNRNGETCFVRSTGNLDVYRYVFEGGSFVEEWVYGAQLAQIAATSLAELRARSGGVGATVRLRTTSAAYEDLGAGTFHWKTADPYGAGQIDGIVEEAFDGGYWVRQIDGSIIYTEFGGFTEAEVDIETWLSGVFEAFPRGIDLRFSPGRTYLVGRYSYGTSDSTLGLSERCGEVKIDLGGCVVKQKHFSEATTAASSDDVTWLKLESPRSFWIGGGTYDGQRSRWETDSLAYPDSWNSDWVEFGAVSVRIGLKGWTERIESRIEYRDTANFGFNVQFSSDPAADEIDAWGQGRCPLLVLRGRFDRSAHRIHSGVALLDVRTSCSDEDAFGFTRKSRVCTTQNVDGGRYEVSHTWGRSLSNFFGCAGTFAPISLKHLGHVPGAGGQADPVVFDGIDGSPGAFYRTLKEDGDRGGMRFQITEENCFVTGAGPGHESTGPEGHQQCYQARWENCILENPLALNSLSYNNYNAGPYQGPGVNRDIEVLGGVLKKGFSISDGGRVVGPAIGSGFVRNNDGSFDYNHPTRSVIEGRDVRVSAALTGAEGIEVISGSRLVEIDLQGVRRARRAVVIRPWAEVVDPAYVTLSDYTTLPAAEQGTHGLYGLAAGNAYALPEGMLMRCKYAPHNGGAWQPNNIQNRMPVSLHTVVKVLGGAAPGLDRRLVVDSLAGASLSPQIDLWAEESTLAVDASAAAHLAPESASVAFYEDFVEDPGEGTFVVGRAPFIGPAGEEAAYASAWQARAYSNYATASHYQIEPWRGVKPSDGAAYASPHFLHFYADAGLSDGVFTLEFEATSEAPDVALLFRKSLAEYDCYRLALYPDGSDMRLGFKAYTGNHGDRGDQVVVSGVTFEAGRFYRLRVEADGLDVRGWVYEVFPELGRRFDSGGQALGLRYNAAGRVDGWPYAAENGLAAMVSFDNTILGANTRVGFGLNETGQHEYIRRITAHRL